MDCPLPPSVIHSNEESENLEREAEHLAKQIVTNGEPWLRDAEITFDDHDDDAHHWHLSVSLTGVTHGLGALSYDIEDKLDQLLEVIRAILHQHRKTASSERHKDVA